MGKRQAAAIAPIGDGQAHERLQQLLQDQGEDAAPPSRSTMQSISIEVRSLRPEEARSPAVCSATCAPLTRRALP